MLSSTLCTTFHRFDVLWSAPALLPPVVVSGFGDIAVVRKSFEQCAGHSGTVKHIGSLSEEQVGQVRTCIPGQSTGPMFGFAVAVSKSVLLGHHCTGCRSQLRPPTELASRQIPSLHQSHHGIQIEGDTLLQCTGHHQIPSK